NGDAGQISVTGKNDVNVNDSIHLPNTGSSLSIKSTSGNLNLDHVTGIIESAGATTLGGVNINLPGVVSVTSAVSPGYDLQIIASGVVNLNGYAAVSTKMADLT